MQEPWQRSEEPRERQNNVLGKWSDVYASRNVSRGKEGVIRQLKGDVVIIRGKGFDRGGNETDIHCVILSLSWVMQA